MTDVAKLQLIEGHHFKTLTEEENLQFERLIAEDPDFSAEVAEYEYLLEGFDMLHFEFINEEFQNFEKKYSETVKVEPSLQKGETPVVSLQKASKGFSINRVLYAVAAMLAIAFIPVAAILFSNAGNIEELAVVPTFQSTIIRGEEMPTKDKDRDKLISAYTKKDYEKTIKLCEAYINKYGNNEYEAYLMMGVAQLNLNDLKSASLNFEHLVESTHGIVAESAEWMFFVAQYKMGNKDVAKRFAEKIAANEGHPYHKEALQVLKKMK